MSDLKNHNLNSSSSLPPLPASPPIPPQYTVSQILNQPPFKDLDFQGNENFLVKGLSDLNQPLFDKIIFIESNKNLRQLEDFLTKGNIFLLPFCAKEDKKKLIAPQKNKSFFYAKKDIWKYWIALLSLFDPYSKPTSPLNREQVLKKYPTPSIKIGENVIFDGDFNAIGENISFLGNNYIGANCTIGNNVVIHHGVVIERGTTIGDDVVINANSVIGKRGFGFKVIANAPVPIPHIGNVKIKNNVDIGANVVIDRATVNSTIIGNYVKIDSLVQIAHNVVIDDGSILVAQSGIAGSSELGKNVILAGQVWRS